MTEESNDFPDDLHPWLRGLDGESVPRLITSDDSVIRLIAGPGSGKTTGLRRRVERLISDGGTLSFRSDYDFNDCFWFPSFMLNGNSTLTFVEDCGNDNVTAAEGFYTMTETEYRNHGQYDKQAEDMKAAAHSLIGMPIQSNKKNK